MEKIGVGCVNISDNAKKYVMQVLNTQRLSHGPFLTRFEGEFSKFHDSKYGITCNSGTDALRAGIAALKEKYNWDDGDEILVPSLTFVASSNSILQNNLKPVFVDIERDYYGINPKLLEERINEKTRAVMPVHLFGMPCEMDTISNIAKKHELRMIEDSCETMFAKYNGRNVGSWGDVGCFSMYAAHLIITGVGGICTTNDAELATIIKSLFNHGRDSIYTYIDDAKGKTGKELENIISRRFRFERMGYSARLTEMEGALGVAQLEEKDDIIGKRRQNAKVLTSVLNDFKDYLQLPKIRPHAEHSFMMYPIVIKTSYFTKTDMTNFLETKGIETRDMLPLTNQPIYKKMFGEDFEDKYPVSKWVNNNGFYIGCHQEVGEKQIEHIKNTFWDFFKKQEL